MTQKIELTDHEARRVIGEELDRTLYVEAGAGTGKTTNLVTRIVAIISCDKAAIQDIAAITFTEAAASELRDRVRESLEAMVGDVSLDDQTVNRISDSLSNIDMASIQTLHSFAGKLVRQFPIEAGITPGFDILDDFEDVSLFEQFWETWLDEKLRDPNNSDQLKTLISLGIPPLKLKQVAGEFWNNYDILSSSNFPDGSPPEPISLSEVEGLSYELGRLLPFAKEWEADVLYSHVSNLLEVFSLLQSSLQSKYSTLYLLGSCSDVTGSERYQRISNSRMGRQKDWETDPVTGENACKQIKAILSDFQETVDQFIVQSAQEVLSYLYRDLQSAVIQASKQRKLDGKLNFHDLLVYARNMVRDNLEVRDYCRNLYKYVLIDEFQDTDPIQAEIAAFLCEKLSDEVTSDRVMNWKEIDPVPGKLFAVGDPKQSIFRFRRADVTVADTIKDNIADETVYLTNNFRSSQPIINWVNKVFENLLIKGEEQPEYIPLEFPQNDHNNLDTGKVRFFGQQMKAPVGVLRMYEAQEVPGIIAKALNEGWPVRDMHETDDDGQPKVRPIRLDDICILSPHRSGLQATVGALEETGIPYRLESAFLMYTTQEITDIINSLKSIHNPRDYVSVVAALKSPVFGCTDAEIFERLDSGKSLDALSNDESDGSNIGNALSIIRTFYNKKNRIGVPILLEEFFRDRALISYSLTKPRPREQWRKYQLLIDKSRVISENQLLTVGTFVEWIETQIANSIQSLDSAVPDSDENAVRIMTTHRSKGLEFPLVLIVGIVGEYRPILNTAIFHRETGQAEIRISQRVHTEGWEELADSEAEQFVEERKRLLYVACTRARDYLVVSLYRGVRRSQSEWLIEGIGDDNPNEYWEEVTGINPTSMSINNDLFSEQVLPPLTKESRDAWIENHRANFNKSGSPAFVTPTQLVSESKDEHFSDDEPWKKGRAGTSIGRAVHSVLQTVDLAGDIDLNGIVEIEAQNEGIIQHKERIALLVKRALDSDIVDRARKSGNYWREVPVTAAIENQVIEGVIDLIFEEDNQLVILDYKTDRLDSDEAIQGAADRYRIQAAAYAYAAHQATGKPVKEVGLFFLHADRVISFSDMQQLESEVKVAIQA